MNAGTSDSPAAADRGVDVRLGVLLFALLILAYAPALTGEFIWDDDAHVTREALRSLDGLRQIWFQLGATQQYYPILHSAFWLEARIWGDAVLGYHAVNLLLHGSAALLVVAVCRRLEIRGAWLAGFLFAVHPVNVESVAWISEQKNTLSLVFYLSAALAYLRFDATREKSAYAGALALFVLALLTKTVTATLPAALLVVFWWKRGRIEWKRDVAPLVPWFVLAAAGGLFTAWVERKLIGAEGAEWNLDALQRLLLAGRVVMFYFTSLWWPSNLTFSYPRWSIASSDPLAWIFPISALGALAVLWRYRHTDRAPLAAALFFGGSLFPVLGFFNIYPFRYSYVADHFQYLASLGIIVPVAALLSRIAVPRLHIALVAILALLTLRQSTMYTDPITLYRTTIARNPSSWMAHNNLGRIYLRIPSANEDAIREFSETIRLKPDHGRAEFSLGLALERAGQGVAAIPHYEAAIRLEPKNPVLQNEARQALDRLARVVPQKSER